MDDEPVMYIVVNSDLKMSKGKIAAQVAHSACKAVAEGLKTEGAFGIVAKKLNLGSIELEHINKGDMFIKWWNGSYTKIILKASEEEIKKLIIRYGSLCRHTYDEGRTQIENDSLTTVAFVPMKKTDAPEELKELKLL